MSGHHEPEGCDGEVTVVVQAEEPWTAHAALAGHFDPLAGHVVCRGRISAALPPRIAMVVLTPHGSGSAEPVEQDPWGNTRIRGSGRPPFPVELLDGVSPPGA